MRSIDIVISISQCITPPKAPFLGHSCVGYQGIPGDVGFTFVTPTFAGITTPYSIQDIKIDGDAVSGWGMQSLQIIDAEGDVTDENQYAWFNAGEAGKGKPAGWYQGSTLADRTFDPSESFLVSNDEGEESGDYTITFAGQVNYTTIPALLGDVGFTCVGNMTPVAKDIQKFSIAGDDATGWGMQSLQIVDAEGDVTDENQYAWFNAGEAGKGKAAGWYEGSTLAVRSLPAGQGFMISNDEEDEYTINIPATND